MKPTLLAACLALLAGCATADAPDMTPPPADNPPMPPGGPNWQKVDQTVQRVRDREKGKPARRFVETERTVERGFLKMSEEDYRAALDAARDTVRKEHPKWSDDEVEYEAVKRADAEKWKFEHSVSQRASSKYELETK